MKRAKTQGLIAAPPTAFREDGDLDLSAVGPQANHLKEQGVIGVFVNGTTGEGLSLSVEEREQSALEWRRVLPIGIDLFVHVGHNSLGEARRLAAHAQKIGADAVAVMAPGFFKPAGIPELVDWCAAVAAAAPGLPFYFYHIPSMTGVQAGMTRLLDQAGDRIPNLAGIKFTFEAMGDFLMALRLENGRYDLLWGRDEMLLGALAMGARGGIGSTFNIAAPLYLALMEAFQRGDLEHARQRQAQAVAFIDVLSGSGNFISALKAVLQAQGVPITPLTRSPLASLSPEMAQKIACEVLAILER